MNGAAGAAREPLRSNDNSQRNDEEIRKLRDVAMELRAHARHVTKLAGLLDDLSLLLSAERESGRENEKDQMRNGSGLDLRS